MDLNDVNNIPNTAITAMKRNAKKKFNTIRYNISFLFEGLKISLISSFKPHVPLSAYMKNAINNICIVKTNHHIVNMMY